MLKRNALTFQHFLYNQPMEKASATAVFESLASGIRLDVYRLLVRKGPDGLVAGEIAGALDIPSTNLSFHLKALTQARLVTVEQEGRFQRYRANMPLMLDLIGYLTAECCAGNPEQCVDVGAALPRSKRAAAPAAPKIRKKAKT
jgi:ArsR family transcriptional regulator, arsenate/arsenite/antimonite-responsive transcriptional repressor